MASHESQKDISNNEVETLTLGQFLNRCREELNMSSKEAAEKAGISLVYLGRLEKDQAKNPSLSVAVRLAELYGVNVETLGQYQTRLEKLQTIQKIKELEKVAGVELLLPLETLPIHIRELYLNFLSHITPR